MEKPLPVADVRTKADGSSGQGSDAKVEVITPDNFTKRPRRPKRNKDAKGEFVLHQRRDAALRAQACATKHMVEANLQKANTL